MIAKHVSFFTFFFIKLMSSLLPSSSYAGSSHPESMDAMIAGRGFTGAAHCTDLACFENNPADFNTSKEGTRLFFGSSAQFTDSLYHTVDNWNELKSLYQDAKYDSVVTDLWSLISSQFLQASTNVGLMVHGLAVNLTPARVGTRVLVHDPVLPYLSLLLWRVSQVQIGVGFPIYKNKDSFFSQTQFGFSITGQQMEAREATLDALQVLSKAPTSYSENSVIGTVGLLQKFNFGFNAQASVHFSGIPIYGKLVDQVPHSDSKDISFGEMATIYERLWMKLSCFHSIEKLSSDKAFWLKNHFGLAYRVGLVESGLGYSDQSLTFGISIHYPIFKITFSSYKNPYTGTLGGPSDRVYWIRVEI